jgi:hypothetical protein
MTQKHPIAAISTIIDDDTGMYKAGEVVGSFDEKDLNAFLNVYGENGKNDLLKHLAFMQYQVINAWLKKDKEESQRMEVEII